MMKERVTVFAPAPCVIYYIWWFITLLPRLVSLKVERCLSLFKR